MNDTSVKKSSCRVFFHNDERLPNQNNVPKQVIDSEQDFVLSYLASEKLYFSIERYDNGTVSFSAFKAIVAFSPNSNQKTLITSVGTISPRDFHFTLFRQVWGRNRQPRLSMPRLGLFCDAVDLSELLSGDFADLLFARLQSPETDQADVSLHILVALCRDDRPICSRLIASGFLDLPANCEPSSPFGTLVAGFCRCPNPDIFAVLAFCQEFFGLTIQSASIMV
jgi:hypothetical protein